jgi:hypothetical protein
MAERPTSSAPTGRKTIAPPPPALAAPSRARNNLAVTDDQGWAGRWLIEIFAVIAPQAVIAVDCAQLAAAVGPASLLAGREVVSFSASLPISAATPDRSVVVVYAPPGTLPTFNDPSKDRREDCTPEKIFLQNLHIFLAL